MKVFSLINVTVDWINICLYFHRLIICGEFLRAHSEMTQRSKFNKDLF